MVLFFQFSRLKNTVKIVIHQHMMFNFMLAAIIYKIPEWIVPDLAHRSKVSKVAS